MADEEPELFIKGYKIDHDKIRSLRHRKDDPQNVRFLSLWRKFPLPFLYLATGKEPGDHVSLVVVLADGYDREALDRVPMVDLSEPYTKIFLRGFLGSNPLDKFDKFNSFVSSDIH